MTGMIEARALAMALMVNNRRPLSVLDAEVRQVLGIRLVADGGRPMRLDLLQDRLAVLVIDFPLWRRRALTARRRLMAWALAQHAKAMTVSQRRRTRTAS